MEKLNEVSENQEEAVKIEQTIKAGQKKAEMSKFLKSINEFDKNLDKRLQQANPGTKQLSKLQRKHLKEIVVEMADNMLKMRASFLINAALKNVEQEHYLVKKNSPEGHKIAERIEKIEREEAEKIKKEEAKKDVK